MTTDQLAERIEAIACRYVRDPVRQLDLTMDMLRLIAEWRRGEDADVLAVMDRAFSQQEAAHA